MHGSPDWWRLRLINDLGSEMTLRYAKSTAASLAVIVVLSAGLSFAQTTVYLRSSGPASVPVTNATNATPAHITANGHGFSSTCGVSSTCYCIVELTPQVELNPWP